MLARMALLSALARGGRPDDAAARSVDGGRGICTALLGVDGLAGRLREMDRVSLNVEEWSLDRQLWQEGPPALK